MFFKLRRDRDVVLKSVKNNGINIKHALHILKDDKEIALAAVKDIPNAFVHISERLKNTKEIILCLISCCEKLFKEQYANSFYHYDDDIMIWDYLLQYIYSGLPYPVKNDINIIVEFIKLERYGQCYI